MFPVIVGHLVLSAPRRIVQHYETAAWETSIIAEPGRYPVIAYGPDVDHVYVRFTGKCDASYLASIIFGRHGSNESGKANVGKVLEIGERQSPTTRTGTDIQSAVLRSDIEWDATVVTQHPTLPWRIVVVGAKVADLSFPVTSVSCHCVNQGSSTEFWQVVVGAETVNPAASSGSGWYSGITGGGGGGQPIYRSSQGFRLRDSMKRRITEAQARRLVEQIKARGTIAPALWEGSY
jgi:hypothetical protein